MGRRALPKIDMSVDVGSHLGFVKDLDGFIEPGSLFGRDAPLEVELGSGKGLFLVNGSQASPEHDFLGVELARKYAHYTAYRLASLDVPNARIFSGDGLKLFHEHLKSESTHAVHVYFPDPWWKTRHKKRRIMNSALIADIQRVLVDGGRLHFWTDVKEYFDVSLKVIGECPELIGPQEVSEAPVAHAMDYRTHFERRTRMDDKPVYRCQFVRSSRQNSSD